ncbi:helix-turn-helix domain-containing protein [Pseudomonas sp. GD03858]|uniref:AlkA N-terminal domain-containing protein n=1 Tax=unclassified Pseudomonas TaxID=196821 RepID=UPI0024487175|nr:MULTISPECIES: AlkA N-terminal domain-containing protein [unclassified Pseudomonas]MDH0645391.1 helix-turn-helix domain-containing protein [Pseudomonas sp. GD03867]MDH0663941.1 helix-turn-helix domain-containing protein [Pseudomonas sp. GD03858]
MSSMPNIIDPPESDACYQALKAHDARFDGAFFAAVTSTGIYCRPVCRVKTPRRENIRFYRHAAQAEAAGFRPCLRCRPELAPRAASWSTEDASRILALQAARLMDEPDALSSIVPVLANQPQTTGGAMARIAGHLGVSDRHLRRIFEAHFGVSPLQYLQTRRLLAAKQLIADTQLPMTQVALSSGFASVRRFNDAFSRHYGLNPSALRRARSVVDGQGASVRLGWRPPYDVGAMLQFLHLRALSGVERVQGWEYARTLQVVQRGQACSGWLRVRFDEARAQVLLTVSDSLAVALPTLISRVRAAFDLDADPQAIHALLQATFPASDGVRVPGTLEGFELAVRAVLGQQITVAAACTLGKRLVAAFGMPVETPIAGLDRLFPTPAALATASGDALGRLGITRQRQGALKALAEAVLDGRLLLRPGVDVAATCAALRALPGIGDWTAQYIALRALRWPDAFPAGDVALHKALGVSSARAATQAAEGWRPWRGYAVLRAWQGLAARDATLNAYSGSGRHAE